MRSYPSSSSSSSSMAASSRGQKNLRASPPLLPQSVFPFDLDEKMQTELAKKGGECLATWEGHTGGVKALAVLPNGWVVSGSDDKTIKCWRVDESTGKAECLATWEGHTSGVKTLAVLPNGWVVSGSWDYTIKCWRVDEITGEAQCLATWEGHRDSVCALAVLPNGWVVSGDHNKTIKCWRVDEITGKAQCLATWEGHRSRVAALAVLPNGWAVSGSVDSRIKCWRVDEITGKAQCLATWDGHTGDVLALAVLVNGWVVSGSGDYTIKCWRVDEKTGKAKRLATWKGHRDSVIALAVLPNGWVLSGSNDKTIKCWRVDESTGNATCLATWEGHTSEVDALAALPNGWVVSGSWDKTIKCWRGTEILVKKTLFELLNVARVFLLQSSQPDLPLEIKLQVVEIFAMNMSYRLPKKIVERCLNYAADRATLKERALTQKGFLKYLSVASDEVENIHSLFKTPTYLEPKAKYYLGLQYKEGYFEDISQEEANREALHWFNLAAQEGIEEALEEITDLAGSIVSDSSLLKFENASCNTSSALPAEDIQKSLDVLLKSKKTEVSVEKEDGTRKRSRSTFEGAGFFTMANSEPAPKEAEKEEKNTGDNNSDYGLNREVSLS